MKLFSSYWTIGLNRLSCVRERRRKKNEPEKPQSEIVMDKLHVKATRAVWVGQLIDFVLNVGRTKKTRERASQNIIYHLTYAVRA